MDIQSRSDIQLAGRAVREWEISDEQRASIVETLVKIATTSPKERHQISAARELSRMVQTNVSARPKQSQSISVNLALDEKKAKLRDRVLAITQGDDGDE